MHLALIGYGNIGSQLIALLSGTEQHGISELTVLTRPERITEVEQALQRTCNLLIPTHVVSDADAILAGPQSRHPQLVVECAGHAAVNTLVPHFIQLGIDTIVASVGAFADDALFQHTVSMARQGNAQLILPAGAIGGIDLLASLSAVGPVRVQYIGSKPPSAWLGTPAENALDLEKLSSASTFFSGTAREAARLYPKNANVAATLALAGAGFDKTMVELVADPEVSANSHAYRVRSAETDFSIEIQNNPSTGNAKTSNSTVYSLLRAIRHRNSALVL